MLSKTAFSFEVPVLLSIWLSRVTSIPEASFLELSRLYASTGRCTPARSFCVTAGRLSSGMVNSTAIGWSWVMVMIPVASEAWTMLPGSTRRRPTTPVIGAVTLE